MLQDLPEAQPLDRSMISWTKTVTWVSCAQSSFLVWPANNFTQWNDTNIFLEFCS